MCPIDFFPVGKSEACSMSKDGTLSIPQRMLDTLGWKAGDEIATSYIPEPLTLLLSVTRSKRPGFKLAYLNRTGTRKSGGKLNCSAFMNRVMRHRIVLPQNNLRPAYLKNGTYQLALVLETPHWLNAEFDLAGCQTIPESMVGVYQILGTDHMLLRVGEGQIQNRIRDHLKDDRLRQLGRRVRYLALNKEDAVILEKVFLALHELDHGSMPPFNTIRA